MRLTGTLRPGATLRRRVPTPPSAAPQIFIFGGVRVGRQVAVSNPSGAPCYVQVRALGTAGFDREWVELDCYNPEPAFTLGWQHLGHEIRVIAKGLDPLTGRPNGADLVSNVIGPVLHDVDPVGTTVTNPSEFNAAVAVNGATVILAAGTTWSTLDLSRNMNGVRITTPQDNPAQFTGGNLTLPGNRTWTNIVFEGVVFRYSQAYALTTAGATPPITTNGISSGITLRGCKYIADNVPPSVYQEPPLNPADVTQGRYWGDGRGMRIIPVGFDLHRSPNVVIEGFFARNVNRLFVLPNARTVRHLRVHGWYGDVIQTNGNFSTLADRGSITDFYVSDCYSIYNEVASQAPHPDPKQWTTGTPGVRHVMDGYMNCIGDTRAYFSLGPITNLITGNKGLQNSRFRRMVGGGGLGSITTYISGSDISLDYMTRAEPGTGRATLRFGGGAVGSGQFWNDEARISRSIQRGDVTRIGFAADGYYEVDPESLTDAWATLETAIVGPISERADTLADLALLLRPRPGFENLGALTLSGHMKPFQPFPTEPTLSATGGTGTLTATLGEVAGAQQYGVRWRRQGTLAWSRQFGMSRTAAPTGLTAGTYDVQTWVRTAAGLSFWSDPTAVVVN